jgi:hypothetical protein
MTHTEKSATNKRPVSLTTRMLIGAGIGLAVISLFLTGNNYVDPAWGKYWMIRPLLVVPFAGAMGGLGNYYIVGQHNRWGLNKVLAIAISLIVCVVGLWLGIVLGLDGTLWD